MTKFCGEALNVRQGRKRATYTGKELKKDMERFLETGLHPHLERVQQDAAANRHENIHALPDMDPTRPHVFIDVAVDNKPAGRLVIEIFEDAAPAAARHLLNRFMHGSAASVSGAPFHKLLPGYALYGGRSSKALFPGGQQVPANLRLQHNIAGAVSVSRDGQDFAISLGKALKLDETHQVVGRVNQGLDVLQLIGDVPCGPDDSPLMRLKVAKCGATNAQGEHEALEPKETKEQAAARLKQESANTRSAVMQALQEGMGHKRSADEAGLGRSSSAAAAAAAAAGAGPGSSKAAAAAPSAGAGIRKKATGAAAAPAANKRSKLLDSLLDDLDEEDGSSSSSSGSEEGG